MFLRFKGKPHPLWIPWYLICCPFKGNLTAAFLCTLPARWEMYLGVLINLASNTSVQPSNCYIFQPRNGRTIENGGK